MYNTDYIKTLYNCLCVIQPRNRGMRRLWRRKLWAWIIRRPHSFPSRIFWPPLPQPPSVSPDWQMQPPPVSLDWSVTYPPSPWRLLRSHHSPPLPRQYHKKHSLNAYSHKYEAIWNVKTKYEVLTIFLTTVWNDFFSKYWYQSDFFRNVSLNWFSDLQSEMNLKKSEAIWSNLKSEDTIRDSSCQSETSMEPVWSQS